MLRLNEFDIATPASLEEALDLLSGRDDVVVVAGGTDLVPKLKRGQFSPGLVVSLADIRELQGVEAIGDGNSLRLGALTTLRALENEPLLDPEGFDALRAALAQVATPIIRTRATLGGNLLQDTRCRYYDRSDFWRESVGYCMKVDGDICRVATGATRCFATFCSDVAPALIVLDAKAQLLGKEPTSVPLESIYVDDGIDYLDTGGAVLGGVVIERSGYASTYKKLRMRGSFDFPEVGVAVAIARSSGAMAVNVAVVGVGSRVVVRKSMATAAEIPDLVDNIIKDVRPMDTMFFPPAYRKKMARRMLVQSFDELLADR